MSWKINRHSGTAWLIEMDETSWRDVAYQETDGHWNFFNIESRTGWRKPTPMSEYHIYKDNGWEEEDITDEEAFIIML